MPISEPSIKISIHALRGEGDLLLELIYKLVEVISIHALRGEGDLKAFLAQGDLARFQSTPSVGRATK